MDNCEYKTLPIGYLKSLVAYNTNQIIKLTKSNAELLYEIAKREEHDMKISGSKPFEEDSINH